MLKNYHFNAHQLLTDDEHSELKTKWTKDLDDPCGVGWRLPIQGIINNCSCPLVVDEIKTIFCYQGIEIPKNYHPVIGAYKLPRKNTYKEVRPLSDFNFQRLPLRRLLRQIKKEVYMPLSYKKLLVHTNSSFSIADQEIIDKIVDLRLRVGLPSEPVKLSENGAKSIAIVDQGFSVITANDPRFWTGHGDKVRDVILQIVPEAEIKTIDVGPNGTSATILLGIMQAIKSGASLVNVSYSVKESDANQRAVDYAIEKNSLITCAISNDGAPASALSQCDGVISVHINSKVPFGTGKERIDCLTPLLSLGGFTGDSAAAALVSALILIFQNKTKLAGTDLQNSFLERCKTEGNIVKFPQGFFQE